MLDRARKFIEKTVWKRNFWRMQFLDHKGKITADGARALRDLSTFCYGNKTTVKVSPKSGSIDPLAMAIAEGRREVFLHILSMLNLDDTTFNRMITHYQQEFEE